MRTSILLLAVALLPVLSGCGSQLGLGRARTMDAGQTRGSVGLDFQLLSPHKRPESTVHIPWALARVGIHHGAHERVELGARVWGGALPNSFQSFGGSVDTKIGIVRADAPPDRLSIAAGLSLSYHQPRYGGNAYHVMNATFPVLVGIRIAKHELVFSPRVADYLLTAYGMEPVHSLYFGMGVGVALAVDKRFELMPEMVGMYALTSFNGEETDDDRKGVAMTQIGLGGRFEL